MNSKSYKSAYYESCRTMHNKFEIGFGLVFPGTNLPIFLWNYIFQV